MKSPWAIPNDPRITGHRPEPRLCDCSNGGGTCDCPHRRAISEVTFERLADAAIMRRLDSDAAYRNAANAEEQATREDEIEREELVRLNTLYRIER